MGHPDSGNLTGFPQGLKPGVPFGAFAARLKSCPDTRMSPPWIVWDTGCPDTRMSPPWIVWDTGCPDTRMSPRWIVWDTGCPDTRMSRVWSFQGSGLIGG